MAQAGHSHCRRLLTLRGESTARRPNRQPRRATPRIQCPLQCRRSLILPPQYSTIVNMARPVRTTPHHGRTACNYFLRRRVAQLQQPLDPPEFMAACQQRTSNCGSTRTVRRYGTGDTLAGGAYRPCVMSPPARGRRCRQPNASCWRRRNFVTSEGSTAGGNAAVQEIRAGRLAFRRELVQSCQSRMPDRDPWGSVSSLRSRL